MIFDHDIVNHPATRINSPKRYEDVIIKKAYLLWKDAEDHVQHQQRRIKDLTVERNAAYGVINELRQEAERNKDILQQRTEVIRKQGLKLIDLHKECSSLNSEILQLRQQLNKLTQDNIKSSP